MNDLLSYDFMQRALIAALVTGITAPAVGIFLVQRKLSLLGDGIGHAALTGVALGLLTGVAPLYTAIIVSALGATAIELIRRWGKTNGDVALAILFYGGIASGVLLANLAGASAANLTGYLFGSLTTVSAEELIIVVALAIIAFFLIVTFLPQFFAISFDEEHAKVSGLKVHWYAILLALIAAVTVTVAMRTVGLLLVSALMVVPVAAAQNIARSFKTTFFIAIAIGVSAALLGVVLSFEANTQPGPTIVLVALSFFLIALVAARLLNRRTSYGRTAPH